jgi:hypothetical protein
MTRLLTLVVGATVLLTSAAAAAQSVDVPSALNSVLPKAQRAGIAVLLPSKVNLDIKNNAKVYAAGDGNKKQGEYELELGAVKGCGGSDACFLAEFTGKKGRPLGYKSTNASLAQGMRGYYKPESCGGSCSPPSIQWIENGVRYEIQARALGGKKAFVSMANSAIEGGNRG